MVVTTGDTKYNPKMPNPVLPSTPKVDSDPCGSHGGCLFGEGTSCEGNGDSASSSVLEETYAPFDKEFAIHPTDNIPKSFEKENDETKRLVDKYFAIVIKEDLDETYNDDIFRVFNEGILNGLKVRNNGFSDCLQEQLQEVDATSSTLPAGRFGQNPVSPKNKSPIYGSEKVLPKREQEQDLKEIDNPFIVHCVDFYKMEPDWLKQANHFGINLRELMITKNYSFTEEDVLEITKQGLQALRYLRQANILHLHLSLEITHVWRNECTHTWELKLTYLGKAEYPCTDKIEKLFAWITESNYIFKYMPPEICNVILKAKHPEWLPNDGHDAEVGFPADMWSWGLTMASLVAKKHLLMIPYVIGEECFDQILKDSVKLKIMLLLATQPNFVVSNLMPPFHNPVLRGILVKMLQGDPAKRPTPEEALEQIEDETKLLEYLPPEFPEKKDGQPNGDELTLKIKSEKMNRRKLADPYDIHHHHAQEEENGRRDILPDFNALLD